MFFKTKNTTEPDDYNHIDTLNILHQFTEEWNNIITEGIILEHRCVVNNMNLEFYQESSGIWEKLQQAIKWIWEKIGSNGNPLLANMMPLKNFEDVNMDKETHKEIDDMWAGKKEFII